MHTVAGILRQRREAAGLTLAALAEAVGVTKGYLSMIENRRVANPPSRRLLEALEAALDIDDGALVRAAGWQSTPDAVRADFDKLAEQAQRGIELARWLKAKTEPRAAGGRSLDALYRSGQLTRQINRALGEANIDTDLPVRSARVPLINRVAAGYPTDFTDLGYPARVADSEVSCPDLADPDAFAARVVGASMEPTYREGDIVIFSPVATITDGCDCFVRLEPDHETTFKRVFFECDGAPSDPAAEQFTHIRLQPLNPSFAPQTVERAHVAGLYRAVMRMSSV